ncbi:MAG: type II and III secretion system protein [Gammaproteobacteria bacterium HGW-Gammaproteobacteria-11]|nr:MAG: type II and III secretion system protein [Gammaproteobacteria bacterium HGW-Gammaproteobacteria-11]
MLRDKHIRLCQVLFSYLVFITAIVVTLSLLFCPRASIAAERIEFYDATLQDFVDFASTQLNKSIVVGADIGQTPISVFAIYESPQQLERLLADSVISSGLYFSSTSSTLRISAAPIVESPDLTTRVFQLQHLQSDFAYQAVRDVLLSRTDESASPSRSTVTPSPTSNAVIVSGTDSQLDVVSAVLEEIDRPRRQVLITAVVAELADDDFEALGLNVGLDSDRLSVSGTAVRPSDRSDLGFSVIFSGPTLSAFLQAVKSTGRNRILSTPQLLTLNRQQASIVVGQNVPFVTGQTTSASTPASDPFQTIVRQDVGVTLEVTPFITPADAIELQVMQSASSVSDDTTAADIITNTRKVMTRVQLQNGEGVLLGGLRSEQSDKSVSRVPILSDLPLVGGIFQRTSERTRTTNLVVLISARIHTGTDHKATELMNQYDLTAPDATGEGFGAADALTSGAAPLTSL